MKAFIAITVTVLMVLLLTVSVIMIVNLRMELNDMMTDLNETSRLIDKLEKNLDK